MAGPERHGVAGGTRKLAGAVPRRPHAAGPSRAPRPQSRIRGAARLETEEAARRGGTDPCRRPVRLTHRDRLQRSRGTGPRRAAAGDVRRPRHPTPRRRSVASAAPSALPSASAGAGHSRSRQFLEPWLCRRACGSAGAISEALLAGRSVAGGTDRPRQAAAALESSLLLQVAELARWIDEGWERGLAIDFAEMRERPVHRWE